MNDDDVVGQHGVRLERHDRRGDGALHEHRLRKSQRAFFRIENVGVEQARRCVNERVSDPPRGPDVQRAVALDARPVSRRRRHRPRVHGSRAARTLPTTAERGVYDGLTRRPCAMARPIYNNILETIGDTPLVRLNRIPKGIVAADVYAKIETTNPGNSIKDRMAVKMIEDAEKAGKLKPGGTIIEGTSGNTGMGLAIAAVVKGYKCIFTTTDKQSKEKVDALRAFGAEVIVCPTDVDPEDPRSYYSVSSRLERETPNSWKANQYDNPSNAQAHYESDRPGDLGADRRQGRSPRGRRRHRRHDLRRREVPEGAANLRSRPGASTPTARSSRSTRRPASSTRTRSIRTSPRASARTSCRRTSTSA